MAQHVLLLLATVLPAAAHGQASGPPTPTEAAPQAAPRSPAQRPGTSSELPTPAVFRVRVVDGRNGAAMDHTHLQLWYDETGSSGTVLMTNAQGIALMPSPIGMPVRVLVSPKDAVDCSRSQKEQNLPIEGYNLSALAATGASSANHCGRIDVKPGPGELVFFARPLRWYEELNR